MKRDEQTASAAYAMYAWVLDGTSFPRRLLFLHGKFISDRITPFGAEVIALKTASQHIKQLVVD